MSDRTSELELQQGEVTVSPPPLSTRIEGLQCPNCAGALEVASGTRVVECPYCSTQLLALHEMGIQRYSVEPQIDASKAQQVARGWLGSGVRKHSALGKEAKTGETLLAFLPFFRVQADGLGAALGTERRQKTVRVGNQTRTKTYEVDVERTIERRFDHTFPAVNVAEWGIQKVDLRGDPLVPYDSDAVGRLGMVFAPTRSESEIFHAALHRFKAMTDPSTGLVRVRFKFVETVRERLSIIYYPIWVVRYHFRGRAYQVLVDAEDGSLSYGKAPGNDLYRALALVGTQAATIFLASTLMQVAQGAGAVVLIAGLGCAAALAWAWRHFRYGGVVIEGSGTHPETTFRDELKTLTRDLEGRHVLGEVLTMASALGEFDLDFD